MIAPLTMIAPLRIAHMTPQLPIIQGGMAVRVSTGKLAAAVANAGGIGTIAGTGLSLRELVAEIRKARQQSTGYVGVNVLFAVNQFAELVKTAMREKVDFIISGAGFSRDMFAWGKEYGVPVISIVSSARLAATAEKMGAAAIVAEGKEAGGHLGTDRSVKEILPEVLKATDLPVIAAGGIIDGFDAAEVIKAGASGVQMATRFVTSAECEADDKFKKMYLEASQNDVVLIKSPVGMPGRALRNKFTELLQRTDSHPLIEKCRQCLKRCSAEYCIMDVLRKSVTGDTENGLVFAGESVYRVKQILPVKEIMQQIASQLEMALGKA